MAPKCNPSCTSSPAANILSRLSLWVASSWAVSKLSWLVTLTAPWSLSWKLPELSGYNFIITGISNQLLLLEFPYYSGYFYPSFYDHNQTYIIVQCTELVCFWKAHIKKMNVIWDIRYQLIWNQLSMELSGVYQISLNLHFSDWLTGYHRSPAGRK